MLEEAQGDVRMLYSDWLRTWDTNPLSFSLGAGMDKRDRIKSGTAPRMPASRPPGLLTPRPPSGSARPPPPVTTAALRVLEANGAMGRRPLVERAPGVCKTVLPQTSKAALPQTSKAALPQTGKAALPQTGKAALPQPSKATLPQTTIHGPPARSAAAGPRSPGTQLYL